MARIAQLILFSLLIGTASIAQGAVEESKSLVKSLAKTTGQAVAEGLTIDLPLNALFWGLGMTSGWAIPVRTSAAVASYMLRKSCNDFYEDENGKRDWKISTLCGFAGGALKYSSRASILGSFNTLEPIVGALDGGLYEATSQIRGNFVTAEIAAIEAILSLAQYGQGLIFYDSASRISAPRFSYENLLNAGKAGAAVGAMVSGTVYTTLTWYGDGIRSWVDAKLQGRTLLWPQGLGGFAAEFESKEKTEL